MYVTTSMFTAATNHRYLRSQVALLSVSLLMLAGVERDIAASNCCSTKQGSGPRVGAFTGNIVKAGDFLVDPGKDTLNSFASLYGYYGNSWSVDGHTGDPLGTGGKWPLFYATELYRDQSVESPALLKNDMREQYVDFGYIPIWRANTLAGFGKWRLSPELTGLFQMVYGGDAGKPGTNSNGAIGIGEVSLQWAPLDFRNVWIKAGNIMDGGTYSSIFDQSPIENFIFTGITASVSGERGAVTSVTSLSFGGNFLNAIYLRNAEEDLPTGSPGFTRAGRQRTFAYAKTSVLINSKLGLKLVGGIQLVPEDSSRKMVSRAGTDPFYHYRKGLGSMGGIEATWFGVGQSHTLVVSGAHGDAIIGSSAPDIVVKSLGNNPVVLDKTDFNYDPYAWEFSRSGSSLLNVMYWNGMEFGKVHLSSGVWFTVRLPGTNAVTFVNPMPDSIRTIAADKLMRDSMVTVRPETFRALKVSVFPTCQMGHSPLYLGLRFDNITYLTPDAHTNALELVRDQTLRPAGTATGFTYGPSRWDREAVNANIVTPSLRLDFNELGGITVAYSQAFYNKPVDRQGVIAKQHGNLTISADISLIRKSEKVVLP